MRSIITILALFSAALQAQRYNFKFYGQDEGLSNLAVQVVAQDRAGFLWVGTQNGLFRYDGNRFTGFGKNDGLPGSRIESVHESIDGTLWVGTRLGLARRNGQRFEAVPIGVAQGILGRAGIVSDGEGRLYLATERGLAVSDPHAGTSAVKFKLIQTNGDPEILSVHVDAHGAVRYGCGSGLCLLDLNKGQGHEVGKAQGLPEDRWEAILEDLDGNLWVRSGHNLYLRPNGAHRFVSRGVGLPAATNTYPTLALDPSGRLLVPTERGLAREYNGRWQIVDAHQGLTSNDISTVIQDREGSIWLGLLGSGLARWLGYNEWESWNEQDGLSRESIWAAARDTHGRLWVGTQFGLNYAEEGDGHIVWRQRHIPGLDMVRSLAASADGALWVAGEPGGVRRIASSGAIRSFGVADGLNSDEVMHVMIDRDGLLWVSTRGGLFRSTARFDSSMIRFERLSLPGTDERESFHMALADPSGVVWAAGDRGLARYEGGRWQRFTTKDGLRFDMVVELAEDPDGSLWIGYRDAYGITHLTFANGSLRTTHITQADGLRSDKSIFLGFDSRGWLWAGSDHGVDVFDHVRWRHYSHSDGLIWDDCNGNAFFADRDGSVWVGTSRGLSRFRPRTTPMPSVPPPVVFTSVQFGDVSVDPSVPSDVRYQDNALRVRFAALTFVRESSVVFRYRLAGTQRDWLETSERELNYPKLPPGQYTLEVTARSAQGVLSAAPARLNFQVLNPWWLTWWFRSVSVAALLVLVQIMWRRRTQRLEDERQRLERAVTERTSELSREKHRVIEEKSRTEQEKAMVQQQKREIERLLTEAQNASRLKSEFLANMSHEIRTPMNGVLGMTDLVLSTELTDEQQECLEMARSSANSLLAILNDILDFSKIEAGRMDLNPIEFSLRKCIEETAKILALSASERKLSFETHVDADVSDGLIGDPGRLRQVLMNLLGNAIKFTSEGGVTLTVSLESEEKPSTTLRFAVKDTGIGIPRDKQELIFEAFRQADGSTTRRFGGTGLGLAISTKLVELMGGKLEVASDAGLGSTFSFNAHFMVTRPPVGSQPTEPASLANMLYALGPRVCFNILLAEDNIVNQRLAKRLLEKRGHRVTVVSNGLEALKRSADERFDLILMDVQMPEMDGFEATRAVRERDANTGLYTPILALTAYAMRGDRERCLEAGMDGYINKPIEAVTFIESVEATARLADEISPRRRSAHALRSVRSVTSGGAPSLVGSPMVPRPRETKIAEPPRS